MWQLLLSRRFSERNNWKPICDCKEKNMSTIWTFDYHPSKFEDLILNDEIKPKLKKALDEIPNIILYGPAGVGKGSFANVFLETTGFDNIFINASDETGIDFIRNEVRQFATAYARTKYKIVVFNEADSLSYTSKQSAQKMLKQLIEDVHSITRFIFLTNNINDIMSEIKSRCWVIEVGNPPKKEIGKLCLKILRNKKIKFNTKDVVDIVGKCYPDIRKTIETLQENTIDGKLTGSRVYASEALFENIFKKILEKDIEEVRILLRSNYIDYPNLYAYLYENAGEFKEPGGAILMIGKYLFQHTSVAIPEINFMTMVVDFIYGKII